MFATAVTFIISHSPYGPSDVILAGIYCANETHVFNLMPLNLVGKRLQFNFHFTSN